MFYIYTTLFLKLILINLILDFNYPVIEIIRSLSPHNFVNLFLNDFVLIQITTIYFCMCFIKSENIFYTLFYFVGLVFASGLFLSVHNLEIFTAFLWMTEVIVILVSLFLIFNLNPSGHIKKTTTTKELHRDTAMIFNATLVSFFSTPHILGEVTSSVLFNEIYFWDDFYESLSNKNNNDLYGFFLSFYYINSFEFLIVGLSLLLASLAYVNLNKFLYSGKTSNYYQSLSIFDFFKNLKKSFFLRKQNLVDQGNSVSSTRKFKKK